MMLGDNGILVLAENILEVAEMLQCTLRSALRHGFHDLDRVLHPLGSLAGAVHSLVTLGAGIGIEDVIDPLTDLVS